MYHFTYPAALWDETKINKTIVRRLIDRHYSMQEPKRRNYRYYIGKHDIETRTRANDAPNNRIICNHAKDIADTAAGYFMGAPVTYNSSEQDLEPLLIAFDRAGIDDVDCERKSCSSFRLMRKPNTSLGKWKNPGWKSCGKRLRMISIRFPCTKSDR